MSRLVYNGMHLKVNITTILNLFKTNIHIQIEIMIMLQMFNVHYSAFPHSNHVTSSKSRDHLTCGSRSGGKC